MSEKIAPALSAAEWAKGDRWPASLDGLGNMEIALSEWVHDEPGTDEYEVEIGRTLDAKDRHAIAALALHDQPFGFTWADVDALKFAEWYDKDWGDHATQARLRSLADRIAALLPPREP